MRKYLTIAFILVAVSALLLIVMGSSFAANNGNGNNGNNGNGNGNKDSAVSAEQTIYLKGSGKEFSWSGWQNIFYTGGASAADAKAHLNGWHLVYTGKAFNSVTGMQVTFTNGNVFSWTPAMGPSVNGGGNNPGWILYAPADWTIAYIDKGNNNESGSFLKTVESGNLNFNISGFNKGTPPPEPHICKINLHGVLAKAKDFCVTYPEPTWTVDSWNEFQDLQA
ncbi:MAG: hypothetical protein FWE80_07705, partial [Oscillospiraceae bacterium]|nr:hypothetical protein [Oscillospiraceae bacterium]